MAWYLPFAVAMTLLEKFPDGESSWITAPPCTYWPMFVNLHPVMVAGGVFGSMRRTPNMVLDWGAFAIWSKVQFVRVKLPAPA